MSRGIQENTMGFEKLTRAKIKFLKGLQDKKSREASGFFVAEGKKMVEEGLKSGLKCESVLISPAFKGNLPFEEKDNIPVFQCSVSEFKAVSGLKNPENILSIFPLPQRNEAPNPNEKILLLDGIADPGNFGTLIRTADWFGVHQIVASKGSADAFNPKALRASMGSIFRAQVFYLADLAEWLNKLGKPFWLGHTEGQSLSAFENNPSNLLVLGNEANGPTEKLLNHPFCKKVFIPGAGAESLNVAVAGGILLHFWVKSA